MRLTLVLLLSGLFAPVLWAAPSRAAETLTPALALPAVTSVAADQYFILLLKWARTLVLKPVTAQVIYRDPSLVLAELKRADPSVQAAALAKAMTGFPEVLRFRVVFRAASRKFLHPKGWQVTFVAPDGKRIASSASRRVQAPELKSNESGVFWQEGWDYRFRVPPGLMSASMKGFSIALAGPSGSGRVSWDFNGFVAAPTDPDAYVPYLGAAMLVISAAVLLGFALTRRPRGSLS